MLIGFNTLLVLLSAASIGMACSILGTYIMLYKKSLVSDAAAHATLPGIALGFLCAYYLGINEGRFLPLLLLGGAITGYLCSKSIEWMTNHSRLYEDTAIAAALSVFFGLGVVLFSIIQNLEGGNKGGLDSFLFGQISGMTVMDATFIISGSILASIIALVFGKYFILFSFDKANASMQIPNLQKFRNLLMLLMMAVVCLGLKSVGAILILALLVIPAASARLLFDKVDFIIIASSLIGIASAILGTFLSLTIENMPTGPAIILVLFGLFICAALTYKIKESHGRNILQH